MNVFTLFLERFLPPKPVETGYSGDSEAWLKDLPKHETFAGGGDAIDWSRYAPAFRYQESTLMCTAFAGTAIASMLEKRETGKSLVFSPVELFTRSNGTVNGNSIQATVTAMQEAVMPESKCPWISGINEWDGLVLTLLKAYAKASVGTSLKEGKPYAVKQATFVNPDRESMRTALANSPLFAILNVGKGYFNNPAPATSSGALHAVVITNVANDGKIRIFDSLTQTADFDGFHWLSADFPILYAFGLLDLPNNWQEVQNAIKEASHPNLTLRYGNAKNAYQEGLTVKALEEAKKKNPTLAAYLVAKWDVYVNAITYGGFSLQDVLNETTSIRRGNGSLFDFNQARAK